MTEIEERSKTQYVLDSLEVKLYEKIKEVSPYYEQLEPYFKSKLKLHALIVKLGHRDKTLAKLVYLHSSTWFGVFDKNDLENFKAKHGKRETELLPLKAIMKVLSCSHRTAQAYLMTLRGLRMSDKMMNEAMELIAIQRSKKESQA